jgi:hypothetical protein
MTENILFNINDNKQNTRIEDLMSYYVAFSNSYLQFQDKKIHTQIIKNKILPVKNKILPVKNKILPENKILQIKNIKQRRMQMVFS